VSIIALQGSIAASSNAGAAPAKASDRVRRQSESGHRCAGNASGGSALVLGLEGEDGTFQGCQVDSGEKR
jgi:hypothetical protein